MNPFNDKPIERPDEDDFDFKDFAKAIAQSIIRNKNPEGTVMAIHGPWGSGKTSIINLVKHYLGKDMKPDQLQILDFKCWWFRGEEALMLEFFHQLYRGLPARSQKAKKAVSRFGSILLRDLAPLTGAAANYATPGTGEIVSNGMNLLSKIIQEEETVEKLYDEISRALSKNEKHYLMIIDDIDRLSEDEVLLIFRLIKSVGRLPKITYLLAYDREVAEEIVSKRYPSEGPSYLEKIVQAPFDIPYPLRQNLKNFFLESLKKLSQEIEEPYDPQKFENLFDNVLATEIQSPRDSIRIMNVLSVTWPAVASQVYPADFLALETLRVQQPRLYIILKANKHRLTDRPINESDNSSEPIYEDIFLSEFSNERRAEMKKILCNLFPPLNILWGDIDNRLSTADLETWKCKKDEWESQKRACSPKYFDIYFRFSFSTGDD